MTTVRIGEISSLDKKRIVNTSAGCYLVRSNDKSYELLVIEKKGTNGDVVYVLPKGHVEWDETLEEAAKRETREESGYTDFKLLSYLGSCTYELDWKDIQLKTDHFYLAILRSEEKIETEPEEYEKGVTVRNLWVDLEKGFKLLTYQNQPEIHDKVREFLKV